MNFAFFQSWISHKFRKGTKKKREREKGLLSLPWKAAHTLLAKEMAWKSKSRKHNETFEAQTDLQRINVRIASEDSKYFS